MLDAPRPATGGEKGWGEGPEGWSLMPEACSPEARIDARYAPTAWTFAPAASRSASFLSVCSQVNAFSVRPKWP